MQQPEHLSLLPSLRKVSVLGGLCYLAHVAAITGLQSLTCRVLGGSRQLLGRQDDRILQWTPLMGLTSLHVNYGNTVHQDKAFEVIAQLTNLQKVYYHCTLFAPGPLTALRSLEALHLAGPWNIPTLPTLTYLGWSHSMWGFRRDETPPAAEWQQSLAGFERLKELDLDLPDHMNVSADVVEHELMLLVSIPLTVTSLSLTGAFDNGPRIQASLSHLNCLKTLKLENYGSVTSTELLYDQNRCLLSEGGQPLSACRVRSFCFNSHHLLHDWVSSGGLPAHMHNFGARYTSCFEDWYQ